MTKQNTLLSEKELIWSPVVANNRMNRTRQASGVNSYANEIGFKPEDWLWARLQQQQTVRWLDVCCGKGNALLQVAQYFAKQARQHQVEFTGIDLVDFFAPIPSHITWVNFVTTSVTDWQSPQTYDLITCIHGLHYIGDKLKVIAQLVNTLSPNGLFVANFDLASVYLNGQSNPKEIKDWFQQNHIDYQSRKKLIKASGKTTQIPLFSGRYLGANDEAGKNYTGQEAVSAYYHQG